MPKSKAFKILQTYQRISIVPFDLPKNQIAFTLQYGAADATQINVSWHLLCYFVFANLFVSSSVYFLYFEATSFVEFSNTLFPTITAIVSLCSAILQIIFRSKTIEIIDNFQKVMDRRKLNLFKISE